MLNSKEIVKYYTHTFDGPLRIIYMTWLPSLNKVVIIIVVVVVIIIIVVIVVIVVIVIIIIIIIIIIDKNINGIYRNIIS